MAKIRYGVSNALFEIENADFDNLPSELVKDLDVGDTLVVVGEDGGKSLFKVSYKKGDTIEYSKVESEKTTEIEIGFTDFDPQALALNYVYVITEEKVNQFKNIYNQLANNYKNVMCKLVMPIVNMSDNGYPQEIVSPLTFYDNTDFQGIVLGALGTDLSTSDAPTPVILFSFANENHIEIQPAGFGTSGMSTAEYFQALIAQMMADPTQKIKLFFRY